MVGFFEEDYNLQCKTKEIEGKTSKKKKKRIIFYKPQPISEQNEVAANQNDHMITYKYPD